MNYSQYSQVIKENTNAQTTDQLALLFYAYFQIWRIDMAEKTLNLMKQLNEEDVLTHLANIIFKMYSQQYDSALNIIDEVKDKYANSFKLMNLKAICL